MEIGYIRSALFVPGNRPDRILQAIKTNADAVIIDLEDAVPVEQKDDIERVLASDGVPIWLPTEMVTGDENIKRSWDVTSDSLAAWLATCLGASRLLLVKSVEVDNALPVQELVRQGIVDASFPEYVQQGEFMISLMSPKDFDQVPQMLAYDAIANG